jgi:hypothetical protein
MVLKIIALIVVATFIVIGLILLIRNEVGLSSDSAEVDRRTICLEPLHAPRWERFQLSFERLEKTRLGCEKISFSHQRHDLCQRSADHVGAAEANPFLSFSNAPANSHRPRATFTLGHRWRNRLHNDLACIAAKGGSADTQTISECSCSSCSNIVETAAMGRASASFPARRSNCMTILPTISSGIHQQTATTGSVPNAGRLRLALRSSRLEGRFQPDEANDFPAPRVSSG